jgi:large subunit ribosomal protein L30
MANLKITQKRSSIGRSPAQRRTLRALGLRKIGHSVVRPDTPDVRGMIFAVRHIIDVTEEEK